MQARRLIRDVVVVEEGEFGEAVVRNVYVSVVHQDRSRAYVETADVEVVSGEEFDEQQAREAISALKGWRSRYGTVKSLGKVMRHDRQDHREVHGASMTPHPNRYLDPLPPPGSVYRLSCEQYEAMARHKIIRDDEPVWLFEGIIVWKGAPIRDRDKPAGQLPGLIADVVFLAREIENYPRISSALLMLAELVRQIQARLDALESPPTPEK